MFYSTQYYRGEEYIQEYLYLAIKFKTVNTEIIVIFDQLTKTGDMRFQPIMPQNFKWQL